MANWTVYIKSLTGQERQVIEADLVDWDDEYLVFSDLGAVEDMFEALVSLQAQGKTSEELRQELRRLIKSFGQIRVAAFRKDAIFGFRLGLDSPDVRVK